MWMIEVLMIHRIMDCLYYESSAVAAVRATLLLFDP